MNARRSPLAGLLVAQFTGAFNDNAWKYVVTLLAFRGLVGEVWRKVPPVRSIVRGVPSVDPLQGEQQSVSRC